VWKNGKLAALILKQETDCVYVQVSGNVLSPSGMEQFGSARDILSLRKVNAKFTAININNVYSG